MLLTLFTHLFSLALAPLLLISLRLTRLHLALFTRLHLTLFTSLSSLALAPLLLTSLTLLGLRGRQLDKPGEAWMAQLEWAGRSGD